MGCRERFYVDVMNLNREVTGSLIQLCVHRPDKTSTNLLIDCGLFQEEQYMSLNNTFTFDPKNIDHVLITHNHVDHTGRLPFLVKSGYQGFIHVSEPTSMLIRYALEDSCHVIHSNSKCKSGKHQAPLYNEADVEAALHHVVSHPYEETFELEEGIKVTFFKNGHLPGAVIGLLQLSYCDYSGYQYEDINILFTGDYHNRNMFFKVPKLPQWVLDLPLTIIQESTYGNIDSSQIEPVFEKNITEALAHNKSVIVPVFSLGRGQEILYLLKQYQEQNKLDVNIPIYFDGKLGIRYTYLYLKNLLGLDVQDFLPTNFRFVGGSEERKNLIGDNSSKIILTTSGMGSYGPAQTYLPAFLQRKNALIHFTGYVAEGTLGRRLYDCPCDDVVSVGGHEVRKYADVKFTSEFSKHAKSDELLDFLKQFTNIKLILINHGSAEAQESYAKQVNEQISPKAVELLNGQMYFRVSPYGLVKKNRTKF